MPWGDGVVDVEDLKVLAEFIGGEVDDPTLAAHWALDETEGDVAYDSLALHDGTLVGGPAWVPAGGMIDGALAFDGIDDHLELGEVVTPSDGPFSVFAWVQGSTPGGVIFSQSVAKNWLLLNPADGTLMTDLSPVGRYAFASLPSSAVIADGQWHRVGVVWDGRARALYVDDALVAEDVMTEGVGKLSNGLYLGCGVDKEASSFFSGLIDDVRIYNRAVRP